MRPTAIFIVVLLLLFSSCGRPFMGETTIVPITDSKHRFALSGSWNHVTTQVATGDHFMLGAQANFPRKLDGKTAAISDSNTIDQRFNELRFYCGLQSGNPDSRYRAYLLGGGSIGTISFLETVAPEVNVNDTSYLRVRYKSPFVTAFAEGGIKFHKGMFDIPFTQGSLSIEAPVYYILHGGIKQIWFKESSVGREARGSGLQLSSPVFGMGSSIPAKQQLVYSVGLSWLISGEFLDCYWDATYFIGNKMIAPFVFRLGFGFHFGRD